MSHRLSRRIEWGDCDPAGIVFNPNFFSFFDHSTAMLYEAAGLSKHRMLEIYGIAGCPLVETRAVFKAPCRFGDEVTITSSFVTIGNSSFDIRHELVREGVSCVEGFETRVWVTKEPGTGRFKSQQIPADVVARFSAAVSGTDRNAASSKGMIA